MTIQELKRALPYVRANVSLKDYTTFKIGGPARYFFEAETKQDLIKAIETARKFNLPFFVLGGGSNLLVADKGYNGLIIKINGTGAGASLSLIVSEAAKEGLTGLEWAIGIPGTVGGAIRGNAGAFGSSMADIVKNVEVLVLPLGSLGRSVSPAVQIKIFRNMDCQFGYRDSIFKNKENLIILSAKIQLKKGNKNEIQKKIKENLIQRGKNQPLGFPSAGSIFKNPKGHSAGELIEKCGLKGKRIGGAQISEKHANFIVNLGGAKARDVLKLIELTKEKVKEKFGINLKEEVQYLLSE